MKQLVHGEPLKFKAYGSNGSKSRSGLTRLYRSFYDNKDDSLCSCGKRTHTRTYAAKLRNTSVLLRKLPTRQSTAQRTRYQNERSISNADITASYSKFIRNKGEIEKKCSGLASCKEIIWPK